MSDHELTNSKNSSPTLSRQLSSKPLRRCQNHVASPRRWLHPALLFVTVQPRYARSAVSQGRSDHVRSRKHHSAQSAAEAEKKIKNDTCPFQCELTARPPGRHAASLSEPLAALDSVNQAGVLWSFCGADRPPLSQVAAHWISGRKLSLNGHDGKQREGRQRKKKKARWLSEKFKLWFDENSLNRHAPSGFCVYGIKAFFRLRSWRFCVIGQPILSSCYS